VSWRFPEEYKINKNRNYDYALIKLLQPVNMKTPIALAVGFKDIHRVKMAALKAGGRSLILH